MSSIGYQSERFVDLSESDKNDYSCSICHEVFRSPVVTQCCHQMFCHFCINQWLKTSSTCPFDRKYLTVLGLSQPPRVLTNNLGKLKIKCDFEKKGCNEVVPMENLALHVAKCRFANICEKCLSESGANHDCTKQLLQLIDKSKQVITGLEEERDNLLQTIQELTNASDIQNPIVGPSDKRVFRGWKQMTFGLEIFENKILFDARKFLTEPHITQSETNDRIGDRIVDIVTQELRQQNELFDICKNVVQTLDMEFGSSWQCVADYDNSSMAYFTYETGCLIKVRFGLLLFKIFKTFTKDEQNFVQRFRAIGRELKNIYIKRSENMSENMISILKRIVFSAIDRFDSLNEISVEIENKMNREFGGEWNCIVYGQGAFAKRKFKAFYISFELLDIQFIIFADI